MRKHVPLCALSRRLPDDAAARDGDFRLHHLEIGGVVFHLFLTEEPLYTVHPCGASVIFCKSERYQHEESSGHDDESDETEDKLHIHLAEEHHDDACSEEHRRRREILRENKSYNNQYREHHPDSHLFEAVEVVAMQCHHPGKEADEGYLGEVAGLECHAGNADDTLCVVEILSEKQSIDKQRDGNPEKEHQKSRVPSVVETRGAEHTHQSEHQHHGMTQQHEGVVAVIASVRHRLRGAVHGKQ